MSDVTEMAREARRVLDRAKREGRRLTTPELHEVLDLIEQATLLDFESSMAALGPSPGSLRLVK